MVAKPAFHMVTKPAYHTHTQGCQTCISHPGLSNLHITLRVAKPAYYIQGCQTSISHSGLPNLHITPKVAKPAYHTPGCQISILHSGLPNLLITGRVVKPAYHTQVFRAPPTNVGEALLFSACLSVCLSVCGHSNSVVFNRISSKFHIWIASINRLFNFEYGFYSTSNNQDGRQIGRHLSISAVVVTLTQSFLIGFLPNFIYELLPSTFRSSLNMGFVRHQITKMADKMAAAYQCQLSWSLLVIFYWISFKFHLWIAFIKLSFKFKYGLCLKNDNQ